MTAELSDQARENLSKLKHGSAKHINRVDIHPQNTEQHEMKKAEICYEVRSQGFNFVTEAEFEDANIRPDIYVLETGEAIEIETNTYNVDERKEPYEGHVNHITIIPLEDEQ